MNSVDKTNRLLGVAFLLQFITSIVSGVFFQAALIVPHDIGATMRRIASNVALMQANILLDMLTALGIVFLGAMLFMVLRRHNERIALVGLGFYLLEAALLAASRADAFALMRFSEAYVSGGDPVVLQTLAQVALESMNFVGLTLHMLAFCLGAILFYVLLYQSRVVPAVLSLWGLITVLPLQAATLLGIFDIEVPFFVALPYVPFEFVIGVWILVKGLTETEPQRSSPSRTESPAVVQ